MIDLTNGELLDVIPAEKADADSKARSYAIRLAMQYVIQGINRAMLFTSIDTMPEYILDYMAVELGVFYYDQTMTIDVKREVIKNAIPWYIKAGTTQAVEDMAAVIFGDAKVTEWMDFEDGIGEPGTFDIETDATSTQESYEEISRVIGKVKNVSSVLRNVNTKHNLKSDLVCYIAAGWTETVTIYETSTVTGLTMTPEAGTAMAFDEKSVIGA